MYNWHRVRLPFLGRNPSEQHYFRLCVPLLGFALLLRNPRLSDEQSNPEAEKTENSDTSTSEPEKARV